MDAASRNSTNIGDSGIFPEPHVGMEFDSEKAAKMFYEDYARHLGFAPQVHHERSKSNGKEMCCEFSCRFKNGACVAMLRIELSSKNKWTVTKFVKEHNHPTLNHNKLHCIQLKRHFATMGVDVVPTGVMHVSVDGNDFSAGSNNLEFSCQRRILGRDAQNVLDYFKKMQAENPGFYYAIHLDDENHMTNAFWADARSRASYSHFGDAVILDTSYRAKQYKVPFAPFTGVNHHGQIILFGCALVFDESEAAFIWLFKTFLAAMNNREPVSFTTDDDGAIRDAASQVFPRARHCINKWHVLREGQQIMARVCFTHPKFQVDLYNCINNTEMVEEFESCWQSIVEKYDLKKNDWLRSVFSNRKRWAPVYFRDSFFATLPGVGPDRSFFNGYVNSQTTLPMFFRQYERALESSFEGEVEADFDTMCTTPLLTPSPMEKQAADLYTKRVFSRFQEELVETFVYTANRVDEDEDNCTYRVAKFEDDRKSYFVSLNIAEMKANCTCMMFEYSGILCRHILTVFTVTNVLTLPSHYILNRWTRNAKSEGQLEPQGRGTLTERYNNLCKEAIRFAMEGAVTQETYNVALASVREGIKKVGGVKKSVTNVVPSGPLVGGVGCDDKWTNTGNPETTPLLWPRQDEITPRFNLYDAGIFRSVSDAAAIRVAPHSLNCSADRADKVPVLPCLKSMTWIMENKDSPPANKIAVINLKLQDYSKSPPVESEVKFSLSRATLEPMLRSMAYITDQLTAPASNVAIINLKLQDPVTTSVESEVKFQLSRDTLGAMLRSMAYIREQLSNTVEPKPEAPTKRLRK